METVIFIRRLVSFLVNFFGILLIIRFFLRLFGANPAAPFADWIWTLTNPIVAPFSGIFGVTRAGALVIDWSLIIALVAYAIVTGIIMRLLYVTMPVRTYHHSVVED